MKRYLNTLIIVLVITAAVTFSACEKDQYHLYDSVAMIQFGPSPDRIYQTSFDFADTLKRQTFVYFDESVKNDTVFFDIYAIGGTKTADRPFELAQEQESGVDNAVAGKHFVAFNDGSLKDKLVIKAGSVHTRVPIVLLRDASLKTSSVTLKLVVKENDNFKLGEESKTWRKVEFTDRLSQPSAWDSWMTTYMLGKYSVTKHSFMIDKTGEKWDQDFMANLTSDLSLLNFYKAVFKTELIEYNKANPGNPLMDEDGDPVIFP